MNQSMHLLPNQEDQATPEEQLADDIDKVVVALNRLRHLGYVCAGLLGAILAVSIMRLALGR